MKTIRIEPTDPCVFQLSGGTTGIPKLIPRTHNDYAYNSKTARRCARHRRTRCCCSRCRSLTTCRSHVRHPGLFFQGGKVVLCASTRPDEMLSLVEKHRVTTSRWCRALLIRLINEAFNQEIRFVELEESFKAAAAAHAARSPSEGQQLIPSCFVQETSACRGHAVLRAADDPQEVKLETAAGRSAGRRSAAWSTTKDAR